MGHSFPPSWRCGAEKNRDVMVLTVFSFPPSLPTSPKGFWKSAPNTALGGKQGQMFFFFFFFPLSGCPHAHDTAWDEAKTVFLGAHRVEPAPYVWHPLLLSPAAYLSLRINHPGKSQGGRILDNPHSCFQRGCVYVCLGEQWKAPHFHLLPRKPPHLTFSPVRTFPLGPAPSRSPPRALTRLTQPLGPLGSSVLIWEIGKNKTEKRRRRGCEVGAGGAGEKEIKEHGEERRELHK